MDVIGLTEKELQTITAAMAGNFPESLSQYRMGALRKLAKAQHIDTQGAVDDLGKIGHAFLAYEYAPPAGQGEYRAELLAVVREVVNRRSGGQ